MLWNLARTVRNSDFWPDLIVGINRGGWPAARVLSDMLDIDETASVKVEYYTGIRRRARRPVITQRLPIGVRGKNILLVDDVADSGRSLRLVTRYMSSADSASLRIATIYYKPRSVVKPDFFERETSRWIIFPWERFEAIRELIGKAKRKGVSPHAVVSWMVRSGMKSRLANEIVDEILGQKK